MSAPSVPAASATGVYGAQGDGGRFSSLSHARPAAAVVRGTTPRPSHAPAAGGSRGRPAGREPMVCMGYVFDRQSTVQHAKQYVWCSPLTFGAIWRPLCPIGPRSARACRTHGQCAVILVQNPFGKLHDAPVRDYFKHHTVPRDESCVLNLQPTI